MPFFIHDNHRLFYREQGNGPLLFILPGNTATSACHQGELNHFGQRYHVVSLDFWGTGQSERMAVWPDRWHEQGAHDTAALIAHLGAARAIVMGTSGGAMVALWTAILYPDRVRAVVADSEIEVYPPDPLRALVHEREQRTQGQIRFWSQAQGEDWEQVVDADSAMLLRLADRGGDLFEGHLGEIACPVLLTASLTDEMLPDVAGQLPAMAGQILGSRLFLVNGGSHPLMWSRAEDFRAISDAFLEQLGS